MRVFVVTIVVFAALAAPASAVTVQPASPRLQRWADTALVPTVPAVVRWSTDAAGCGAVDACALEGEVFMNPADMTRGVEHRVWLHELGHQFDYDVMTDRARAAFEAITRDRRPWRSSPNSPHEQFAVAYQQCALRRTIARRFPVVGDYGWWPTPRQHRLACHVIREAAAGVFRSG